MRTYTGSTSCDDRATRGNNKGKIMVNLLENIRDPAEIERLNNQCIQYGKPPHYDLEKAQRNIVYERCRTREEAFLAVFEDAMERYNSAQKRSDRKTSVEKELAKLDKGKIKQELIHTMIIQVGNKENHPSEEECVEILNEYLEQFRQRFPNMKIVSAALHLDEDTPHLQIYFIGVKTKEQHEAMRTGKKWSGMDIQPSLTGALEQMGYDNSATVMVPQKNENGEPILGENGEPVMAEIHDYKNGAMAQWQRDFNGLLDEICMEHGIELDHYQRGQKVSHQDTLDYQEGRIQRDVTNAKNELNKTEADLTKALFKIEKINEKADAAEARADKSEKRAAQAEARADAAEARLAQAEGAFARFKTKVSEWVDAHNGLQRILRGMGVLSDANRDKIEYRMEKTVQRVETVLSEASESLEDLMAAENELEFGTREMKVMKKAAQKNLDIDKLLDDDGDYGDR